MTVSIRIAHQVVSFFTRHQVGRTDLRTRWFLSLNSGNSHGVTV